jgi:uncharacterized damage-inducible protein DinB
MNEMLTDLYGHQAWADAEHWRAFEAHPPALEDAKLRERLHHIHLVQRAFLALARGRQPEGTRPEDFPDAAALKEYGRTYHEEAAAYLTTVSADRLAETLVIPWFRDPPIRITVAQALTQAAMHSHYHRAQNATRLRELGGEPTTTDLILWWWKGRPAPRWS